MTTQVAPTTPEDTAVPPVDFDTAYAAALAEEITASGEAPIEDTPPELEPEPAPAEPAPVEPEPAPAEPAPVEPAPAAPEVANTGNEALLAQIAELQAQIAEAKKPVAAPVAAEPASPPPTPVAPPSAETLFTDDEKQALATYEEDWPEVSKAEGLRTRLAVAQAKDEIYREVAKVIGAMQNSFQPVVSAYTDSAEDKHFAAIKEAHKDYSDALVTEVETWASKQPTYLKTAATAVLDHGTAEDVIDLFNRFKKDVGKAEPHVPQPTEPPKPTVDPEVVRSLTPVKSGRNTETVVEPVDKNDFESAWRAVAATG